ncbi:MAG TPA: hypothetical protein VFF52_00985 [Isosphaeraceae bacterium]|nr:hypothetical protein [Isosphaeraceae bacterium]
MTVRRRWAAILVLAGLVSGCGEPPGKVITPPNLGPPTEAQIKKMQEMMGGTMSIGKEAGSLKKGGPGRHPGTPPK